MQRRIPKFDPQMVPIQMASLDAPAVPSDVLSSDGLRNRFIQSKAWEPEITDE